MARAHSKSERISRIAQRGRRDLVPRFRQLARGLRDVQHPLALIALVAASALHAGATRAQVSSAPDQSAARASEHTRVVLIGSPGMEELVVRFMAELDSLQLEVVRAPDAEAAPSMTELEELARSHAARVAVRVRKAGRAVDLWLVNPHSHEL